MSVDWFTVIAQVVNFLVLVWLMKRYLYQPVLNAIDARERRLAAQRAEAESRKAEAEAARAEFARKLEEFEQQRAALWSKTEADATAEGLRLREEVRKQAADLRDSLHAMLSSEYRNMHEELTGKVRAEVFSIARKLLEDLADAELGARMVELFVRRLRELDSDSRLKLAAAHGQAGGPAVIRSAFDLSQSQRASIENAVKEVLAEDMHVRFESAPELIGGLELTTVGEKLGWSIADYLGSLENEVDALLRAGAGAPVNSGKPPGDEAGI